MLYIDLQGKVLYRQVGVATVVTSGSTRGVMVAHWHTMPEMWFDSRSRQTIFHITAITYIYIYLNKYIHKFEIQ